MMRFSIARQHNPKAPMEQRQYTCEKCHATTFKAGEIRTTGSGISRLFNLQNQKYQTVSCTKCGFTELYRLDGSGFGNVIDLFAG
jgi:predicted nucleic-acid-binding Zn-ribbon protein